MKKYMLFALCLLPVGLLQAQTTNIKLVKVNKPFIESASSNVKPTESKLLKPGGPNVGERQSMHSEEFKAKLQMLLKGSEGVGGGHEMGLSFKADLESALESFKTLNLGESLKLSRKDLQQKLDRIKIVVVDQSLSTEFKDYIQSSVAVNIPSQNLIVISQPRWMQIQDAVLREGIALHEFLSLLGIESTGYYPVSSKYVSQKGISETKLADSLHVNRLAQIRAMDTQATPFQVLEKFYLEAQEPVNWEDLKKVQSNLRNECSSIVTGKWVSDGQPVKYVGNNFYTAKLNVYNETITKAVEDNGPLFPGKPSVVEPRFFISLYLLKYAISEGATVTASPVQIEQKNNDHIRFDGRYKNIKISNNYQTIRKNMGLLVYKESYRQEEDGRMADFNIYGYCYPTR